MQLRADFNCEHWRALPLAPQQGHCAIGAYRRPSRGTCLRCKQRKEIEPVTDIVLRNFQGAGDQVLLTGTLRDLHAAYPDRFRIGVECWGKELFWHHPHLTPREQLAPNARVVIVESMAAADDELHLTRHFNRMLSEAIGLHIPTRKLGGDIHLSYAEKQQPHPFDEEPYWMLWAGGHWGFTTKLWNPLHHQAVVDHFRGKLRFVQAGAKDHFHPRIDGARDLVGQTSMREMVMLMYHAEGGVGPISFGMHLAAGVPVKLGAPLRRPYVVVAGGREGPAIFQYPNHHVLQTVGKYRCCLGGACWKNHCDPKLGKGVTCEQPVPVEFYITDQEQGRRRLQLARCMTEGVTPAMVIEAIEGYRAAATDHRRAQQQRERDGNAAAAEKLPICLGCSSFMGQRARSVVGCSQIEACCGETVGTIDLTVGKCPMGKHNTAAMAGQEVARV